MSQFAAPLVLDKSKRERTAIKRERGASFPSTVEEKRGQFRDDPTLVRACRQGDENAWRELVDKYGGLVYSIARRNGLSEVDAEDIVQTVFTIALQQIHTLRKQACLAGWLATISNWQSLRLIRRTRPASELDESVEDQGMSVPEQVRRWEIQELVRQAVNRLDPRSQALVRLLFLEPLASYADVAARLGIPEGSIGPTRARCFKQLRRILDDMHVDFDF